MAQQVIHRPARLRMADPDLHPIELHPPPSLPNKSGGQNTAQLLMPLLGGAGSMIMIVTNKNPVMLIAGGVMLCATLVGGLVMFLVQKTGNAKRNTDLRRRYLDYLDRMRGEVGQATIAQRDLAVHHHPAPADLPEIARNPIRLWERRPRDPDFLIARIGVGTSPLWQRVTAPPRRDPLAEPDIIVAAALLRLVERDRMVHGMPVAAPISGRVSVVGAGERCRATVRAALAQIATLHSPDDVRIFAYSPRQSAGWLGWLKWLPHCLSQTQVDGNAPRRQFATTPIELDEMLGEEFARRINEASRMRMRAIDPHSLGPALVVVIDNLSGPPIDPFAAFRADIDPANLGIHLIFVAETPFSEPERVDVRISCLAETVTVTDLRPPMDGLFEAARNRARGAAVGRPDVLVPSALRTIARELTAVRLVEESAADAPLEATLDLTDLVGVPDVANFDPRRTWLPRPITEFLRVPFGIGAFGERVFLDLKEAALGGMGPHGLCVGATGSGKSEVLRTIVLTQAMSHPPERLALVLVDYKGGATFAGLEDLPHCAAMISNLSDDDGLVDRLHDALFGEMKRRQQVLADSGNLPNVTEYNRRRDAGEPMEPLPNLFVVIDEFGELLTAKPDFIELFLAIGRIGRSIGVHLLLASQRLEEGRLRGLESFLSYRLGLRTFNAGESRSVLGVPDAYELPPIPGSGYLKVDTTVFQRFKAAYVSGTYQPPATGATEIDTAPVMAPYPLFNDIAKYLSARDRPPGGADEAIEATDVLAPSVLDVAVRQLQSAGVRTAQIWLPPLPAELNLDVVTGAPRLHPQLGLRLHQGPADGQGLPVPVGLLDKPAEQRQQPLVVDLAASGGHLAILGAPQTGKSTLLRTLIVSAALNYAPGEVAFFCLDLGGGSLRMLADLPHVAAVAPRLDAERVRRSIAEVRGALVERESLFSALGLDSVEAMRQRYRQGLAPELPVADIFLIVDNYSVLKTDFDDQTDAIQEIAARGPGYGIHLILTAGRWADLRMALQSAIGTKIEFRLNDPAESTIARKASANLRADTPGRCIIAGSLQAQICLPQTAGSARATATDGGAGPVEALVAMIARAWPGPAVPALRTLPTMIDQLELSSIAGSRRGVIIAIDETEMKPVEWDCFGSEPHLLIIGDSESGKTSLLRTITTDLAGKMTDEEVIFAVFDVRRTLLDILPDDYLGAYAGTAAVAAGMAGAVAGELLKRLPPDTVTAAELKARSWWQGPEIFVIADDYDLLSPGGAGPLAPFLPYLAQARDLGFHMVLARRSGGAGRAIHEPLLQRMKESGATGVLLSGDRQEGAIFPGAMLSTQPPGRGLLARRGRRPALVQLAFRAEEHLTP